MSHPSLYRSIPELFATSPFLASDTDVAASELAGGLSGARLERLLVTGTDGSQPQSYVLKQLDATTNWLMRAADDTACREVLLTQSPLWERMPAGILMPVVAGVLTPHATGALLMPDVTQDIFPREMIYAGLAPDMALVARIIDHIAAMHAAFWQLADLRETVWLTPPAATLFLLTPEWLARSGLAASGQTYGDAALRMWPYLWPLLDPDDAASLQQTLAHPEALLQAYAQAPATLVHGDPWLANMGEQADRLILLDWALATAGPATIDSLWFAHTWHALDPDAVVRSHRAALLRHGVREVADDQTWQLLVELGWIRTTLVGAEWLVRDVRGATTIEEQQDAIVRLRQWCHVAAGFLQQRGW